MSSTANRAGQPGKRRWWLVLLAVAVLMPLLYSVYGVRQRTPLRLGEPSPQTFVAPVATQVTDYIATQRLRMAARGQIETVYSSDPALRTLVSTSVGASGLPSAVIDAVLRAYQDPAGIRESELDVLIRDVVQLAPADRQREVRFALERRLIATSVPDDRLTTAARDAAAAAVPPVMQTLESGQVIVEHGTPLTDEVLQVLDSLGLYSARTDALTQTVWIVVGCALLALLLSTPLMLSGRSLLKRVTFSQMTYLVVLTLGVLAVQRLASGASPLFLFALLVPLIVAVLLGEIPALLWAGWMALAVGLLVPASPLVTIAATLVGSVVAVQMALVLHSRLALLLAGGLGGLAAGISLMAIVLVGGGMTLPDAAAGAAFLVAGGVLAGVMALGLLPVAESVFSFLTEYRLLELSSPSNALLQRLVSEAPGTYQHSIALSNMVEQAVKNIGGNALLARVGALLHDVGKIRRPQFFIENQFSGDNPHDRLSPHLSYLIVVSHVRDGLELAREYRLPRELEDFIAEHHGTTMMSYFYKRALDEGQVEELSFRYPGPKPRTKETAVLMLADSIESASRTLRDPSPSSLRALIDRLIDQRLQDGQLTDSPLNLRDLEVIASTFERMLTAALHRRIDYPSAEEIRKLRRGSDGMKAVIVPDGPAA
ncbi:MAG: HDIG domain-containing protein [Trueperaceae bacterium]|nr:HDIG domain-containing protein [Trueperaceae bacterium]